MIEFRRHRQLSLESQTTIPRWSPVRTVCITLTWLMRPNSHSYRHCRLISVSVTHWPLLASIDLIKTLPRLQTSVALFTAFTEFNQKLHLSEKSIIVQELSFSTLPKEARYWLLSEGLFPSGQYQPNLPAKSHSPG